MKGFKRGDLVYSKVYGTGTVIKFLGKQYDFPIEVKFTDTIECFTKEGEYHSKIMKDYILNDERNIKLF